MPKNKFESLLELLVNEEHDKARELMHQIVVEKARAIHDELMSEEDEDSFDPSNAKDEINSEEYFGEAEDDEDMDHEDAEDELSSDLDEPEVDEVDADEDMGDDEVEDDMEEVDSDVNSEDTVDDRLEDLETELAHLQSQIEELMTTGDDEMMDDADEEEADVSDESDEDDHEDETDVEDEDYDDLDESVLADMEHEDSFKPEENTIGTKGNLKVNSTSPVRKNDGKLDAKGVQRRSTEHKGYDRETAPSTQEIKFSSRSNQRKKAADTRISGLDRDNPMFANTFGSSKTSGKDAVLNKDFNTSGKGNMKSPLGSK